MFSQKETSIKYMATSLKSKLNICYTWDRENCSITHIARHNYVRGDYVQDKDFII